MMPTRPLTLTYEQFINNQVGQGYRFNQYEIVGDMIGWGTYGIVFKAKNLLASQKNFVAIKVLNIKKLCQDNPKNEACIRTLIIRQIQNMKKVKSEHVIKFYQSMMNQQGTLKVIVMEFCEGPTLEHYILNLRKQKQGLIEEHALKQFYQIAEGVYHLYSMNIMHRDLHPGNIMKHNDKWVIIDLGYSKLAPISQDIEQATYLGNHVTIAPQIIDPKHKYGKKVDVWSLGVILYFILTTGHYPFKIKLQNATYEEIHQHMKQVLNKEFKQKKGRLSKSNVTQSTVKFLQNLLQFHQEKRFDIRQVINHPIFKPQSQSEMVDESEQQETYTNEQYMSNM